MTTAGIVKCYCTTAERWMPDTDKASSARQQHTDARVAMLMCLERGKVIK